MTISEDIHERIERVKNRRAQRLVVCEACPALRTNEVFKAKIRICSACGCAIETKVILPNATCPLQKW